MISFHPIAIEDKPLVEKYTLQGKRQNCDLSFANLYSWRFLYRTQVAEKDGFLLFRFYVDEELTYMMPVGEGDPCPIIEELIEDAQSKHARFRMTGICANMLEMLKTHFSSRMTFTSDRDYADYIYLRTDLATLSGKKYQPKRNHVNRFKKSYPDHSYEPLSQELVNECLRLETQWCKANNCAENEALESERQSMTDALKHMEELNLLGGILRVDGKIAAFTFGAPINQETFDVCVEKANTEIEGAYAVINQEFASRIPEQYVYVNREEDLGIEGLRKSKLSYQPEILLEKYTAELL